MAKEKKQRQSCGKTNSSTNRTQDRREFESFASAGYAHGGAAVGGRKRSVYRRRRRRLCRLLNSDRRLKLRISRFEYLTLFGAGRGGERIGGVCF
ncbi:unnamed protein product [Citrullus colocynthis]|uniref:Uncharacterized protein n=1 Tax=Citrullus colocynthis TaxID=252529 RepID=A0ABP0Z1P2_9ROSI